MDLKITPSLLKGEVTVPPSKSVAHRMLIAASLADGISTISNISGSADILATIGCMRAFGADIELNGDIAVINGIRSVPASAAADCRESGSTLRFLIPVACALGINTEFFGQGKLPQRPITPFVEEFPKHGVKFDFSKAESGASLPCSVSGKLTTGHFEIDGGISSQFITGLMFALPLLDGDSEIILRSRLESKPYIDITMGVLRDFGCEVTERENGYFIKGNSWLKPFSGRVEGDYSQSAFFYVANALGSDIQINGLSESSFQGDKRIMEICREFSKEHAPFEIDCSDIPDLVPILSVLGCFCKGTSRIYNAARLRIKECDRLAAMEDSLNRIGGRITSTKDSLIIEGVDEFKGGEVICYNDHRIAMSMAIAATRCTSPLILHGAECVKKSYPNFFNIYQTIGGKAEEI